MTCSAAGIRTARSAVVLRESRLQNCCTVFTAQLRLTDDASPAFRIASPILVNRLNTEANYNSRGVCLYSPVVLTNDRKTHHAKGTQKNESLKRRLYPCTSKYGRTQFLLSI